MGLVHTTNEYHIPRGRVYFDPANPNTGLLTGESPFGNCPGFTIAIETEKANHYSSESGLRQKDASTTVEVSRTATVTVDNISVDNLARYLSGTVETVEQNADPVVDEAITVLKDRIYQVGRSSSNPAGARNITAVAVKNTDGTVTYVANTDYAIDLDLGRLQILPGGVIADNAAIKVSYSKPATSWRRIKTGAIAEMAGAIRVIADNAQGANRDWYMPKVNITPSGELPVVQEGVDYTTMTFEVEILAPANGEAIYCDGRPVVE